MLAVCGVPGVFDGAEWARFRLFSEIGTYSDHYLHPDTGLAGLTSPAGPAGLDGRSKWS